MKNMIYETLNMIFFILLFVIVIVSVSLSLFFLVVDFFIHFLFNFYLSNIISFGFSSVILCVFFSFWVVYDFWELIPLKRF